MFLFVENKLVINSTGGKTEPNGMPLGTSKNFLTAPNQLKLFYDQIHNYVEESFKHIGTIINTSLNLEFQFHKFIRDLLKVTIT